MVKCLHPECGHPEDEHTRGDGCMRVHRDGPCPCGAFQRDLGADRDTRPRPCQKHTWCILLYEHAGSCAIVKSREALPGAALYSLTPNAFDKGKIK